MEPIRGQEEQQRFAVLFELCLRDQGMVALAQKALVYPGEVSEINKVLHGAGGAASPKFPICIPFIFDPIEIAQSSNKKIPFDFANSTMGSISHGIPNECWATIIFVFGVITFLISSADEPNVLESISEKTGVAPVLQTALGITEQVCPSNIISSPLPMFKIFNNE